MVTFPAARRAVIEQNQKPEQTPQQKCEAKGWIWDSETQSCNNPNVKKVPEEITRRTEPPKTEEPLQEPIQSGLAPYTIKMKEQGRTVRIGTEEFDLTQEEVDQLNNPKLKPGYKGLSPQVKRLKEIEQGRTETLQLRQSGLSPEEARAEGATEEQLAAAFPEFSQDIQESIGRSEQVGNLQGIQEQIESSQVDYLAAFASGVPDIIPDLIAGGAAVGGAAFGIGTAAATASGGALAAPSAAAVAGVAAVGAITNAVRGYYTDVVSDIKNQRQSIVSKTELTLQDGKSNLNDLITAANGNPNEAQNSLTEFNKMLSIIDSRHEQVKRESQNNVNKFLGINTIDEMAEYNTFYNEGERANLIREMAEAQLNPDVAKAGRLSPDRIKELKRRLRKV